jgi:mRNA deadenylase 3'-5' endonuclease subunit Ccr4
LNIKGRIIWYVHIQLPCIEFSVLCTLRSFLRICTHSGDMNSDPTQSVYHYLTTSSEGCSREVTTPSVYKSIYKEVTGEEPRFTSWKYRSKGEAKYTIDFILYNNNTSSTSTSILKPVRVNTLPTEEDIGSFGLPTQTFPSDHLPLTGTFSIL